MINADEMVTPGTIRNFLDVTIPLGLGENAVQPSFGMLLALHITTRLGLIVMLGSINLKVMSL